MNRQQQSTASRQESDENAYRTAAGQAAFIAGSNHATQQGAIGPASSIGLLFPAFQPKVSGKLLIAGYMHVTDTVGGDLVTFQVKVDGAVTDEIDVASATPGAHDADATFSGIIVNVSTTATHSIQILATSGAGQLSSAAGHQRLTVIELPG